MSPSPTFATLSLFLHCFRLNLQSLFFHLGLQPYLFVSVISPLFGRAACHWDLEENWIELWRNFSAVRLASFPPHNRTSFSYLSMWGNGNRPCTILFLILLNWIFHITGALRHQPFPLTWPENPFHNIWRTHSWFNRKSLASSSSTHTIYLRIDEQEPHRFSCSLKS